MCKPNHKFHYRERELQLIINTLLAGEEGVLLTGLRRTGKSWIIKQALALIIQQQPDKQVIYIDVQNLAHLSELFSAILNALPKNSAADRLQAIKAKGIILPDKLMIWIGSHLSGANAAGASIEFQKDIVTYWKPLAETIQSLLLNNHTDGSVILALDELPFFLENLLASGYSVDDVRLFLATLRQWREAGLVMMIGGSISLEHQLDVLGIPRTVLGKLSPVTIDAFTLNEAREYLQQHTAERQMSWWTAAATSLVLERITDHIPYFLHVSLNHLQSLTATDQVDACLNNHVIPGLHRAFLYQFDERLSKHYNDVQRRQAQRVLDNIARKQQLSLTECQHCLDNSDIDIYGLLSRLQRDDFLRINQQQQYTFSLDLLHQWWAGRLGIEQ
jgi:hypothetical protein